jgi:hypothetical protein
MKSDPHRGDDRSNGRKRRADLMPGDQAASNELAGQVAQGGLFNLTDPLADDSESVPRLL